MDEILLWVGIMNKYEGSERPWWIKNIDKIFLGGGIVYLLFVSFWLLFQSRQSPQAANANQIVVTETGPVVVDEKDRQFMVYLQQSLETLNQPQTLSSSPAPTAAQLPEINQGNSQGKSSQAPVAIAPANQGNPLPPPPPPVAVSQGNAPPAPGSTTLVERYYYPVYPNAPTTPTAPPPVATAPPVPMVRSATKHDLVGVLESGQLSSALFRWNGMTQRIQIGEAIGSSGWQLASVTGQQAILSRQGKTRYLEVGQSF